MVGNAIWNASDKSCVRRGMDQKTTLELSEVFVRRPIFSSTLWLISLSGMTSHEQQDLQAVLARNSTFAEHYSVSALAS